MKKTDSEKILKHAKKIILINYKGGKCKYCDETNHFKLTFHHINNKEFSYSDKREYRLTILKKEVDKCDILCQNCHREYHFNNSICKSNDRRKNKEIYLEYSGSKCVKCGYNKCKSSLTFHHRSPDEKKFWIGSIGKTSRTINELSNEIIEELDKCDILCANCHVVEHSDIKFFEENRTKIYEKINNYKEIQVKIDRNVVIEMYTSGIKQIDISKKFNSSKSTISKIIKKYTLTLNNGKDIISD